MATYNSFTELPIWMESVDFAVEVYKFCEGGKIKTDLE